MARTELRYSVVRYMLNPLADEAANVGLIAIADDPPLMLCHFLQDVSVKSRNDVRVKKELVERFKAFVTEKKQRYENQPENRLPGSTLLQDISEFGAGIVQCTTSKLVLATDIDTDFKALVDQWVEPHPDRISRAQRAERDPLAGFKRKATIELVKEFRQGYGSLQRDTFRRAYPVQGQVRKNLIDFAMLTPKREHLFQHVLVFADAEETVTHAAGVCWKWDDIQQTNHVDRDMTAVLYDHVVHHGKGVKDATELLHQSKIKVARLEGVRKLAQQLKAQPDLIPK